MSDNNQVEVPFSKRDLDEFLSGEGLIEDDPETVVFNIASRYATATSADDILAPQTAISGKDYVGQAFVLTAVEWRRSKRKDSLGKRFAVMHAANVDGEPVVLTCGATQVVVQLARMLELDALPRKVVLRTSSSVGADGNTPLWLERPDADF